MENLIMNDLLDLLVMMLSASAVMIALIAQNRSGRVWYEGLSAITLAAAFVLAFSIPNAGCGATPQQTARHFVDGAGEGLRITDDAFAPEYTRRARAALDAATSMDEYRSAVRDIDAVAQALDVAHRALEIGDSAVRIWDQGGASSWPQTEACIAGALVGVRDALVAAGTTIPPQLSAFVDGVRGAIDPDQCFAEGT